MNIQERMGESVWNTYKSMAYLVAEVTRAEVAIAGVRARKKAVEVTGRTDIPTGDRRSADHHAKRMRSVARGKELERHTKWREGQDAADKVDKKAGKGKYFIGPRDSKLRIMPGDDEHTKFAKFGKRFGRQGDDDFGR